MKETKPEPSINPIIVKKEPGTGSLFPICTFETLVLHARIRNKELAPGSRFPDSINSFEISHTFTQIRNKEPVPDSRFPIISFILINAPWNADEIDKPRNYFKYADK